MNPFVKTCLVDSHRTTQTPSTDESDPYFDENEIKVSTHSADYSLVNSVPTPSLGNNIIRNHKDRDPYDVFEPAKLLGNGSMVRSNLSLAKSITQSHCQVRVKFSSLCSLRLLYLLF